MAVTYIFPEMNFSAYSGDASIKVSDGRLELKEEPTDKVVLDLIQAHGGIVETAKKTSKARSSTKKLVSNKEAS